MVHCVRQNKPYRVLRVGPNEAYHEIVVCTTSILAYPGGPQHPDPGLAWSDARQPGGWLTCPPHVVQPSAPVSARKRPAYPCLSLPRPPAQSVAICGPQLAPACPSQLALGRAVVPQRMPGTGRAHRLALAVVAVAGSSGRLAGTGQQPLWRAGRWLLWQGQRLLLVGYVGLALHQVRLAGGEEIASGKPGHGVLLGLGCQQCGQRGTLGRGDLPRGWELPGDAVRSLSICSVWG